MSSFLTRIGSMGARDGGGIYLFKDEKSVKDYLSKKIVADIMKNPALSDIDAKVFDVLPERAREQVINSQTMIKKICDSVV